MPFLSLKIAAPELRSDDVHTLHAGLTERIGSILGKKTELTSVLIEQVPVSGWAIGAADVPLAAHLDVKVTIGTNTDGEKNRFIAEAHDLLRSVLGGQLPVATYVVIDEVPAGNWGYGGRTQEQRR